MQKYRHFSRAPRKNLFSAAARVTASGAALGAPEELGCPAAGGVLGQQSVKNQEDGKTVGARTLLGLPADVFSDSPHGAADLLPATFLTVQVLADGRLRDPQFPGDLHLCVLLAEVQQDYLPLARGELCGDDLVDDGDRFVDDALAPESRLVAVIVFIPSNQVGGDIGPLSLSEMRLPEE